MKGKVIGPLSSSELDLYGGVEFLGRRLSLQRGYSGIRHSLVEADSYDYFLFVLRKEVVGWLLVSSGSAIEHRPQIYVMNKYRRRGIGRRLVSFYKKERPLGKMGIGWDRHSRGFWMAVDGGYFDTLRGIVRKSAA